MIPDEVKAAIVYALELAMECVTEFEVPAATYAKACEVDDTVRGWLDAQPQAPKQYSHRNGETTPPTELGDFYVVQGEDYSIFTIAT